MKILLCVILLVVSLSPTLMISAPVKALASNYQFGFQQGVSDAHKDVTQMYILEPDHGFQYQFNDTIKGYVNGFCSVSGGRMDTDYASFDCAKGPDSASWVNREYHFMSGYKAGFDYGVSDAKQSGQWYILQPDNGFLDHSQEFNNVYVEGFCSICPNMSSDADQATWDCPAK